jgi:hypothetical protein
MQHRVGARALGVLREVDGFGSGVGAGAGDHRHALPGHLDAQLDDALVLVMAERGALARGADRDQPVRALGDLPLHEPLERRLIDLAVLERRDQCRE